MGWEEKRAFPRVEAAFAVKLAIEVGLGGSTPANGTTINISRGGLLAAVDHSVPMRAHCNISFGDAGGRVEPTETSGFVRRVTQRDDDYLIGIEFDRPLTRLEVRQTLWKKKKLFAPKRRP